MTSPIRPDDTQPAPLQREGVTQVFLPNLDAAQSELFDDLKLTEAELESILIKRD